MWFKIKTRPWKSMHLHKFKGWVKSECKKHANGRQKKVVIENKVNLEQINSCLHESIRKTLYVAMFENKKIIGLTDLTLKKQVYEELTIEYNLEMVLNIIGNTNEDDVFIYQRGLNKGQFPVDVFFSVQFKNIIKKETFEPKTKEICYRQGVFFNICPF